MVSIKSLGEQAGLEKLWEEIDQQPEHNLTPEDLEQMEDGIYE